ncbi:MAG: shikimate dehydrogenase [Oscillospiraceae bacterium]|nr:shikimate dehydrogenase [Oscillospiraceae bacterium]
MNQNVKKYGLLGYPLGHSLSDYIHRRIFELCGLEDKCEYALYEVAPEELSLKGQNLRELQGFNVTIPYKTEIIPFLDKLDASAADYGAVNCVKIFETDDGLGKKSHRIGYNTDGYGFLKALELLGATLTRKKVLLLGCGGTARMMAFEAAKANANLTLAIRRDPSEEKAAAKLSRDIAVYGTPAADKTSSATGRTAVNTLTLGQYTPSQGTRVRITYADSLNIVNDYDLLLNATPCGMHPNADELPLCSAVIGRAKHVFDAVYNPCPTKLLKEAQKRGAQTLGGMAMLVHQAIMAEKIWNGDEIQISDDDAAKIIKECEERL